MWGRAALMSLLAIGASTIVNFGIAAMVAYPSTTFDQLVGFADLVVTVPFVEWYMSGSKIRVNWLSGFIFGVVLLGMQFAVGIVIGIIAGFKQTPPPEYSAHPLVMFILITVLTLLLTSGTGAYLSKKSTYATS